MTRLGGASGAKERGRRLPQALRDTRVNFFQSPVSEPRGSCTHPPARSKTTNVLRKSGGSRHSNWPVSSFRDVLPAWWPDKAQGAQSDSPFRPPDLELCQPQAQCMAAENYIPASPPGFGEPGTTVSPAADLNTAEAAPIGYAVASRDAPRPAAVGVGSGRRPRSD